MTRLEKLRKRILGLDEELLAIVRKRIDTAMEIGRVKQDEELPLQNFVVEKAVIDHALESAKRQGIDEETARQLFKTLMASALTAQERARVRRKASSGRRALVVGGAGLMGGWFARFLSEQGFDVQVQDPRPSPWPAGDAKTAEYDLIVVATPPSAIPSVLDEVGPSLSDHTLLVDIASIKGPIEDRLRKLAAQGRKVASLHPMFGPSAELLMGRNVLVLDCGDKAAAERAQKLFSDTAALVRRLDLAEHDAIMADVLGLAHATSIVFNIALASGDHPFADLEQYASTTFRKQVDVSREVARENPDLYFEIQTLNRASRNVVERLAKAVDEFRRVVEKKDLAGFRRLMSESDAYYRDGGGA